MLMVEHLYDDPDLNQAATLYFVEHEKEWLTQEFGHIQYMFCTSPKIAPYSPATRLHTR